MRLAWFCAQYAVCVLWYSAVMKSLWVVMMMTFISGFASGIYVFAITRDSSPSLLPDVSVDTTKGFSVTYDAYGACRSTGCVSYRVSNDGAAIVSTTVQGRVVNRRDVTLTADVQAQIVDALKGSRLSAAAPPACAPVASKVYVRIGIRIGVDTYIYDTCTQSIPDPLGTLLMNYQSWLTR